MTMNFDAAVKLAMPLVFNAEGCKLIAYLDTLAKPAVWTIGHGATSIGGKPVQRGMTCTQAEADAMAERTLTLVGFQIARKVRVLLTDHQAAALLSFVYNIGIGHFETSTVLAALNVGKYQRAADLILDYDEAGGEVVAGLETRRAKERALFLAGMAPVHTAPEPPPTVSEADALNEQEIEHLNPGSES